MNENKHLTLDERNFIEQELAKNTNFKEIARYLRKDPTTISKEIRKHRIRKEGQAIHVNFNHCAKKFCNPRCTKECRHYNHYNEVYSDFVDGTCFRLTRAPYICNGCTEKYGCKLTKYYYRALPIALIKIFKNILKNIQNFLLLKWTLLKELKVVVFFTYITI